MRPYRARHLATPPTPDSTPDTSSGASRRSVLRGGVLGAAALSTGAAAVATPAATAAGLYGQDVSGWQGEIDWSAQAELGSRFAYVKATEGRSYRSPAFNQQYRGAGNAGLVRGG
ncbi:MAG: GH25 family lysozyme, partial [Brachybacterium tyrofermentans]